ncbi:hypothetical protein [Pseudonocardia xishanensis]|uniref:AttH domain-containing protein n=1 Tax=Pseudonocardia xishanensis TaxID=630995 RepID=A0ABP8RPL8_9PSEU
MLHDLDESLHHQTSRPVRLAATSDHRFYDRYWFEGIAPDGDVLVIAGLAIYRNTGMCDGFVSVQRDLRQTNVRFARPLADDLASRVGSLAVDVVDPFRHLSIVLEAGDHPLAAQLAWRSDQMPHLEQPTVRVEGGRITQDSSRYGQLGTLDGWLQVDGERIAVDQWWAVRDHSWGVRPGVGGFELPAAGPGSSMHLWTYASAGPMSVHFQQMEDGTGEVGYLDGAVTVTGEPGPDPVLRVDHDITFVPDTREWQMLQYVLTTAAGRVVRVDAEAVQRAWAYRGTGYSGGYDDRRGLGAPRPDTVEWDVLDLATPGDVRRDGDPYPPGHREQPARVTIDGVVGFGHVAIITSGTIPRYGLVPRRR